MTIHDEHNTPWLVKSGDPAAGYVNILKRKGFRIIILPRKVLTGELEPATMSVGPVEVLPSSPPSLLPPPDHVRLIDCLEALQ